MNLASLSAQQSAALAAARTAAGTGPSTAATAGASGAATPASTARSTLAGNFDNFLKLLMTQLKNQDPTSPLDTNQFTSQLVQFTSVEQQINANANLTKLIELTQADQVLQAASVIGKRVSVTSDHIPLQGGSGQVNFTAATPRSVAIAIMTDAGVRIRDAMVPATAGDNTWVWDGRSNAGAKMPDGSYRIAVIAANSDGSVAPQPFVVQGTATAMRRQDNAVRLQLGTQATDLSAVQQILP